MTLGEIISSFRKDQSMSRERFSKLSGLTVNRITMLEHGTTGAPGTTDRQFKKDLAAVSKMTGLEEDELLQLMADDSASWPPESYTRQQAEINEQFVRLVTQLPLSVKKDFLKILQGLADSSNQK